VPPRPRPSDALSWIESELADNGGTLPSSFDPTAADWGLTLDAVIALHLGGRGTGAAATAAVDAFALAPGDYVTGEAFGDVGSAYAGPIGKSLYALGLLGEDVNAVGGFDLEALSRAAIVDSGDFAGRFSDVSGSFGRLQQRVRAGVQRHGPGDDRRRGARTGGRVPARAAVPGGRVPVGLRHDPRL
jgi:hypothetical protein